MTKRTSATEKRDARTVEEIIVARIRPLLAGHDPGIQGMVIADLLALWLAGHPSELRESLLTMHIGNVRELVVINAAIMGTGDD